MKHEDKRLCQAEETLLRKAKGARLLTIDAVFVGFGESWNAVRLHFEDFDIDVTNYLGNLIVDELGSVEEFGLMHVVEASKDILDVPAVSAGTSVLTVNEVVREVLVVNDVIDIFGDGIHVVRLEYPQAIAFKTGKGTILLDKEVWFSEMIAIRTGDNLSDLLYDESINWEDIPEEDPSTHYEFRTETVSL